MSLTPYNGDIKQCLKWLQNNAPNIQSLIQSKSDWYQQYHTKFWTDWESNIFDLRTCNAFGLMIWCIILNVPSDLFGLFPLNLSFAFGNQRQNFTAVGDPHAPTTDPNTPGGNFYGGGNTTLLDLTEVRWALMLRYVSLVSDGRLSFINEMLNFIFNNAQPWDFPGKNYFYVADSTLPPGSATITGIWANYWEGNQAQYSTPRTNIITYSNAFSNAAWSKGNTTLTQNQTGPDGVANSAWKLADSTSTLVSHSCANTMSSEPTTTTHTVSCFAKAVDRNFFTIRMAAGSNYCYIGVNLSTGVIQIGNVGTATGAVGKVTALANGWYKCSISGIPDPTGTTSVQVQLLAPLTMAGSSSYTGVTGQGIAVYGAQVEVGGVPTSYIPTTAAATSETDYTLNATTGVVTFAAAPITGAALTWTGGYNQAIVSTPYAFGTGNGSTVNFTLKAPGSVAPITQANYMEYRIGANTGISSQFVNLLNSPQYGICPSCAGVKYLVVQET